MGGGTGSRLARGGGTMAVGMSAQQHPEIGSAMAKICQSLFAGHEVPADG